MRLMGHLKRLVLADNPLLGRDPAAPQQCLGPWDIDWLDGRLLKAAPLHLLDVRRTGALLLAVFGGSSWCHLPCWCC